MRLSLALVAGTVLLLAYPANAGTGTATSSTGNVDTWNLPHPEVPPCNVTKVSLQNVAKTCGLVYACPQYIAWYYVTLTLVDPSPGDMVAVTAVGKPGTPLLVEDLANGNPSLYPTDIATYDDPVAQVPVQIGGCDPHPTVVVTGLLVEGEVTYEIAY